MKIQHKDIFEKAKSSFRSHGGILKTSEAIRMGIHPRTLYHLRDVGIIEKLNRGLYRLADLPAPHLYGYSKESEVAEKFEAMVKVGILNSRLKDFYNIWFLSQQFDFDGQTLATAISKTFTNRRPQIPSQLSTLTNHFAQDSSKKAQWHGFIRKNILKNVPEELSEVVTVIVDFLGPVIATLSAGQTLKGTWNAQGPARCWNPI